MMADLRHRSVTEPSPAWGLEPRDMGPTSPSTPAPCCSGAGAARFTPRP
jgi:hypothetical protein